MTQKTGSNENGQPGAQSPELAGGAGIGFVQVKKFPACMSPATQFDTRFLRFLGIE